jgi:hypothetical protein
MAPILKSLDMDISGDVISGRVIPVVVAPQRADATAHPISVNGASCELFRLHAARGPREETPSANAGGAVR